MVLNLSWSVVGIAGPGQSLGRRRRILHVRESVCVRERKRERNGDFHARKLEFSSATMVEGRVLTFYVFCGCRVKYICKIFVANIQ